MRKEILKRITIRWSVDHLNLRLTFLIKLGQDLLTKTLVEESHVVFLMLIEVQAKYPLNSKKTESQSKDAAVDFVGVIDKVLKEIATLNGLEIVYDSIFRYRMNTVLNERFC